MPKIELKGGKDPDAPLERFDAVKVSRLLKQYGKEPQGGWTAIHYWTPSEVAKEFGISKEDILNVLKNRR